ncbi:MAG: hypothetical protein AW09_000455 [Candidatus Accumulibacter phosphatis]|uniref:Uncharacterized protein n=1 Tax=Candidatus Accumulibacter phosphatis TaxID=327160 RepID=A0A080LZ86_9PROT|nr:MAG: hypothetical protein AW09_000455 [Candidatus Accumulibacter phosphatis]
MLGWLHRVLALLQPLPADNLEAVGRPLRFGSFLRLPVCARVYAVRQQLARLVAALPGVFQTHVRVHAQGKQLLFPVNAVLQTP